MGCNKSASAEAPNHIDKCHFVDPHPSGALAQRRSATKQAAAATRGDGTTQSVMGRYTMRLGVEDLMGQGTSSMCRRGSDDQTGKVVAIKVYKSQKNLAVTIQKFRRQIDVLKELLEPFRVPSKKELWHERLELTEPKHIFMELLDYSRDIQGLPGPDVADGKLYVVTEIAQYSLKDFLAIRRDNSQAPSKQSVRNVTEAILTVMAGLHAKGLVHLDFKPENVMMFDGKLKLIDVDGCVKTGSSIQVSDSSISFSPCYCAPEWAKFLVDENNNTIFIQPSLDVWSVGMTICELVALDAVLKPMFASFAQGGRSPQEAGLFFMEWLGSVKKAPSPKSIDTFDPELGDLITQWLCVPDQGSRKTCSQALMHPYLAQASGPRLSKDLRNEASSIAEEVNHAIRLRLEDEEKTIVHKGTLWKLNARAKPSEQAAWVQYDIWITPKGNLCYWSQKDNMRLVLLDAHHLHAAQITAQPAERCAKEFAFRLDLEEAAGVGTVPLQAGADRNDNDDESKEQVWFATTSDQDRTKWLDLLKRAAEVEMIQTFRLGGQMEAAVQKFKIAIKNRRMEVEEGAGFDPVFTSQMWKLKGEGDVRLVEHWYKREFSLTRNGSFTYWSAREEKRLVYYTAEDISGSTVTILEPRGIAKPFGFAIALQPNGDIEFEPGSFAAESAEARQRWLQELAKQGAGVKA